jgi:CHAT domain-containing protein/Tfp pilus assembly protein PilF
MRAILALVTIGVLAGAANRAAADPLETAETSKLSKNQQARLDEAGKLDDEVHKLYGQGKAKAAVPLAKQALAINKEVLGEKHPVTALSLNNLGLLLRSIGDYAGARPYYEQALAIRKEVLGEKHPATATSLNNLGFLLNAMGDYPAARPYYEQALAINQEVLGEKHPDTANSLNSLGFLLQARGDYAGAKPYFKQALAIYKEVLGDQHPDTARSLNNLGSLFSDMGDYAAAKPYYEQALAINKDVLGEKHRDTATSLNNLGGLLNRMGDYAAARPYYEQALAIKKEMLGEKHPATATSLNNLGFLLKAMGDYPAARSYYEQALAIRREVLGERNPDTALSLNNLGHLLSGMGDYAAAKPYYERALAIYKEVLGDKHPATAGSNHNLGALLQATGDYAGAKSYYEQALAIYNDALGDKHPDTAMSLDSLGLLHKAMGDFSAARSYCERALAIRREMLGDKHPDTAKSLGNLCMLSAVLNDLPAAAQLKDEERHVVRRHVARVLPGLAERQQLVFLQSRDEGPFHASLSLGLHEHANPALAALSAGWLANGKALAHEALAERTLRIGDSRDPKVAAAANELIDVRRQLAGLAMSAPKPGKQETRKQQVEKLEAQEQVLARRVAQAVGQEFRAEPWIEVDELRKSLPADGLLIDIARFHVVNFQARGQEKRFGPAHYAAWLIPPAGQAEIQIIDLGAAEPIEQAVRVARHQLAGPTNQETLQAALARLTELVWQPLGSVLGDAKQLVLSPDGALWLVPWEALLSGDGGYLIESYHLRYVTSSRDLVRPSRSRRDETAPVIFADPNYDLSPGDVVKATQEIFDAQTPADSLAMRGSNASRDVIKVNRLPGTKAEAEAVKPRLATFSGKQPLVYTDRYALEDVFRALHRPQVLVLSTHGFFKSDQQVKLTERDLMTGQDRGTMLTAEGKPYENPLLRCGLLLAGCNQSRQTETTTDGVLTGMEILGADLRGTQLVVLSACETGLGEIQNGEGVAGLRQAFQVAGAQAVIASLWKIPDQETTWLMTRFWENVAAGKNQADALRDAQLMMLYHHDELRALAAKGEPEDLNQLLTSRGLDLDDPGPLPTVAKPVQTPGATKNKDLASRAHPFYWAAFTITGQTESLEAATAKTAKQNARTN